MQRRSVLYLNHSAQMSGAEASLRSLLLGLQRIEAPIDPVVALPDDGPLVSILREEGIKTVFAPLQRMQRPRTAGEVTQALSYVLQTVPKVRRLIKSSSAHLLHSNSTTAHLIGAFAAKRAKRPAIWHCRDLVPLPRVATQLAARSALVIAISKCVAQSLQRDGVPDHKIRVIYNGLDPDEWRPRDGSALRDSLGLTESTLLFGMVGQMVPWKNHRAFIEAAVQLVQDERTSHMQFAMIGGDLWNEHRAYTQELRDLIQRCNLTGRFHLVPNQSDAVAALSALDCLVHPTTAEPFGRVIIEAMSLRKPVIARNENGPREILTHEQDGLLVSPQNQDELAFAMKRLAQEPSLRQHLGEQARVTVEERFHFERHAREMAGVYEGLIGT